MNNRLLILCLLALFSNLSRAAATIVIVNADPAGVGFNDPAPTAPIGGNTGTTVGQQRLNVYQAVAAYWGAQLNSAVVIRVRASWEALTCTATSAVLGSAGPASIFAYTSEPGFVSNHWYHKALANKLAGEDLAPDSPDINARFNVNLGQAACLAGSPFYLGLDNNHGSSVDFYSVLLHELGHGLGFSTTTNGATGGQVLGVPAIWDYFLFDTTQNLAWDQMTNTQRQRSGINYRRLVWNGANVTTAVPQVLSPGFPQLQVTAPAPLVNLYFVGTAAFGPVLNSPGVTAEVMPVVTGGTAANACTPFTALDAAAVNGKIALIDRGTCAFSMKAAYAQTAGAVAVIIANNAPGVAPGLAGTDPTITIPVVSVSQSDGNLLKAFLQQRSRTHSGLFATVGINLNVRAGADLQNRALMYTPDPYASGSSVSHFDTSAFPNLIMEPNINGDLQHTVLVPFDLTLQLLKDIGWN